MTAEVEQRHGAYFYHDAKDDEQGEPSPNNLW